VKGFRTLSALVICLLLLQPAFAGWTRQRSGTLAWLRAVSFVDADNGWVGGSKGTLLTTDDGGAAWKLHKKVTDDNILDVRFSDHRNGWLLCERDIFGPAANSPSYFLHTTNGGEDWERIDVVAPHSRMRRMLFSSGANPIAIGEGGSLWQMEDDKRKWKRTVLPVTFLISGGTFTDQMNGVLVGGGGTILYTADGGFEWSPATIVEGAKTKLNAVAFPDQKFGWAVGARGKIYFSNNGGKLWYEQQSATDADLFDAAFLDANEGYVVGDKGTILHTTTAGKSWIAETGLSKSRFERVSIVGQCAYVVGFGGEIFTTCPDRKSQSQVALQEQTR